MQRDPQILAQIEEIDALLLSSGVRDMCLACWRGQLKNTLVAKKAGYPATYGVGCCNGCELLMPTACAAKPISCAVWLCHAAREKFPKVAEQLDAIRDKQDYGLLAMRKGSLDFEISRLKCAR